MTDVELDELIADCPTLFHMAEGGAWDNIRNQGLLSTTALLDTYEVNGTQRHAIERCHRPSSVDIEHDGHIVARIRDQKPMSDGGLQRALPTNITPSDWYANLNGKVFFWLTNDRLNRLLTASSYRDQAHDVLEVDTGALVAASKEALWLCPINSGCTKPFPWPRDYSTFQRISSYPYAQWRLKRRSGERVVELAVDYSVPNIAEFTKRVTKRKGSENLGVIWER